ncbi:MAG: two-component regulator propeller domain-containing protein, partial [Bacteroidota bacterium]
MKNYLIGTLVILLTTVNVSAQKFTDCSIQGPLFVRVESAAEFNGSLQNYFEKELQGKLGDFNGIIQLGILIDTSGKACCMNIDNNLSSLPSTDIKDIINKMTRWTPARQNNYAVNFNALINLLVKDSRITVNYINKAAPVVKPVINTNTRNNPETLSDGPATWKLWNFSNSIIPANLSRNVTMDSDGVIWYCTDGGIVRIEGKHWKVFNGMNTPALAGKINNTWTTGLAVDRNKNVWVETFGAIVKYDGRQWTKYDTTNSPLKLVRKVSVDRNGIVWFCTFDGLIKFDGNNWTKFSTTNSKIASDDVREVYLDAYGTLWIATSKGINTLKNGDWNLLDVQHGILPDNAVNCIKGDKNNNIWAGVGDRDKNFLVRIDPAGKVSNFPSGVIWNITVDDPNGKIWLATNGQG